MPVDRAKAKQVLKGKNLPSWAQRRLHLSASRLSMYIRLSGLHSNRHLTVILSFFFSSLSLSVSSSLYSFSSTPALQCVTFFYYPPQGSRTNIHDVLRNWSRRWMTFSIVTILGNIQVVDTKSFLRYVQSNELNEKKTRAYG